MFDTLVESGSHSDDLARKGSFFLGTVVIYAIVLLSVSVLGIYLYNDSIPDPSLELLTLVAPAPVQAEEQKKPDEPKPAKNEPQVAMRQEISVVAPVVASHEVAKETTKEVPRAISQNFLVGNKDIGTNEMAAASGVVPTGGVGGGTGGPVVGGGEEPPPPPPAPKPTPTPEPRRTVVSGGVLTGKAISKPPPAYPAIAKAARAQGTVVVQITVDESGRVVSASAISGNPLLQQAAVSAVRNWRFSPTMLSGQPVKVTGTVTVNFTLQ
jgi:protein TonB